MMTEYVLPSWIEEGVRVRFNYGEGNPNNKLAHVRAIVDGDQIVYCVWLPKKQRYSYRIDDVSYWAYIAHEEQGVLSYAGKDSGWMAKGYTCER